MPDLRGFLLTRSVAALLDVFGYARTTALLDRRFRTPPAAPPAAPSAGARAEAVVLRVEAAASRGPLPVGCLPRALCVRALLAREGIEAAVRIGVRRDGAALRAHAWIEHEGAPVAEASDVLASFAPFDHDFA
ncbi:MAG TPA: lasso peptide biosynthesis B2 protein [Candidatus Bathyarchaeia archaeon]|nr:lasso peptide biosynthesis B2 protein [Candidatus Bathyarchaeia archaeon]